MLILFKKIYFIVILKVINLNNLIDKVINMNEIIYF